MIAKVYIETLGCQMNVADTERARSGLLSAGYALTESEDAADVVMFNSCSVRARATQKLLTRIGEVRYKRLGQKKPVIGVMGCVAQLEGSTLFDNPSVGLVVGTRATDRLPGMIASALEGRARVIDLNERAEGEVWNVPTTERLSKYVAFVPIIEGCNKFCSYCIVPFSRGRERSRAAAEILSEVRQLQAQGYREIHLIGQNVNSYRPKIEAGLEGFGGATPFCRLLRAVAATGMERIKFTTSFPRDFHPDIVRAIEENENLCDWIHLPAQSGSDRILKAMRRGHNRSDYLRRIETIKNGGRKLSLTSDIIVGFPGETEADFADTMKLVADCKYDGLYIFKYSERPGTPAAQLRDDVSRAEKTARFLALERLQRQIQTGIYQSYLGREVRVLVERESSRSENDKTGHSTCHKVINFPGASVALGQVARVQISAANPNSLYGDLLDAA
ncbi:MAG: tRNA-2-methylthio-N6-dimethylallyladenosine synthase [Blastocatellia bacterium]|jgi:tRNA-2-methylthio-N6-dimethylallyladenosine synthase|nr:tRNA-2-methylthio-N6-dimethylallyladenosine synthase [Blastocatellia bacterium]